MMKQLLFSILLIIPAYVCAMDPGYDITITTTSGSTSAE